MPADELLGAARAIGVAAVAAPDVYYAVPGGALDHRVRTAIRHNALAADLPEAWLAAEPAHLLAPAELAALCADLPDLPREPPLPRAARRRSSRARSSSPSAAATPRRSAACTSRRSSSTPDETAYSRLCEVAFEGARRRYRPLRPEVVRRLDYELDAIDSLGFAPYFLLVLRIADFAREKGIPCVGRGSAADSLVSYCLGLTDADPLRYRLPFERFLNPARKDRPDIDLDFCWRRRDEVIAHVYAAFGQRAHGDGLDAELLRRARRVPRDGAGRGAAAGGDQPLVEAPARVGALGGAARRAREPGAPIERALRSTPECRDFPLDDGRWRQVLRASDALLDTPRHFGLHPGGVVVSPGPITDFSACHASAKGPLATQFDKDAVEAIGLVKMDLLGNRALTTIDDCQVELAARGIEPELERPARGRSRVRGALARGAHARLLPGRVPGHAQPAAADRRGAPWTP